MPTLPDGFDIPIPFPQPILSHLLLWNTDHTWRYGGCVPGTGRSQASWYES